MSKNENLNKNILEGEIKKDKAIRTIENLIENDKVKSQSLSDNK